RRPNNRLDTWHERTYRRWIPENEPMGPTTVRQFLLEVSDPGRNGPPSHVSNGNGGAAPGQPTEELLIRATGPFGEERLAQLARSAVTHVFGLDVDVESFRALALG